MAGYIFKDLNVRDPFVTSSTALMLEDTKVVVQSIWRLITTVEGEIPNFRNYGLDLKQFSQYPLTKKTLDAINKYVTSRIEAFEGRATIARTFIDASIEKQEAYFTFYVQVKSTGETAQLPTWTVKLSST